MTGIYSVTHPLTEAISNVLKNGFHTVGELAGRVVKGIRSLPDLMQNNRNVAIGVFSGANAAFFTVAYLIVNFAERRILKHPEDLDEDQTLTKDVLVNAGFGATVLVFNVILSKITHYPLSKTVLGIITIAAIAVRILINRITAPKDTPEQIKTKEEAKERRLAEKKAEAERKLAEKNAAEERKLAEKNAAEEKKLAEKNAAEERKLAEKNDAEERKLEEKNDEEKKRLAAEEEKRLVAEQEKKVAAENEEKEKKLADENIERQRLLEAENEEKEKILAAEQAEEKKRLATENEEKEKKLADEKAEAEKKTSYRKS